MEKLSVTDIEAEHDSSGVRDGVDSPQQALLKGSEDGGVGCCHRGWRLHRHRCQSQSQRLHLRLRCCLLNLLAANCNSPLFCIIQSFKIGDVSSPSALLIVIFLIYLFLEPDLSFCGLLIVCYQSHQVSMFFIPLLKTFMLENYMYVQLACNILCSTDHFSYCVVGNWLDEK